MRKMLMLATVPSMIGQFNMDNINLLMEMGIEVHVACNFLDYSVWDERKITKFCEELNDKGIQFHSIAIPRNPLHLCQLFKAFTQLSNIVAEEDFQLIHCHTPSASVVGRIAAQKHKIKVIYTAHGFHFFKGAPIKNWLLFYPVEKILSKYTDVLITINKEDFAFAQKHMNAKKIVYVHGVGVNSFEFRKGNSEKDKCEKIEKINDEIVLLSVGELNKNKNHIEVIKELEKIKELNWKYIICGAGELEKFLKKYVERQRLCKKILFLGYRNDMKNIYQIADIFIFPSKREGLSVALMEAMSSGLPVVCSDIRGNRDLVENGKNGFLIKQNSLEDYIEKIKILIDDSELRKHMGNYSRLLVRDYDIKSVRKEMKDIYREVWEDYEK